MAGRLTLIMSVLMSIPIHTLSVLPAPKGTLKSTEKLLRSFLWGNGRTFRRHWVNWENICKDVKAGGLGIIPLCHVMTALRGKMDGKYLCNDSLWAKHDRSRFVFGGKGSHLWNTISPFITSISHGCQWAVSKGNTSVEVFCHNLAMSFPKKLKFKSIKEVLSNPELRRVFMHNMNPQIHLSLQCNFNEVSSDKLVWDKDPSGFVSTKAFLKVFVPKVHKVKKFEVL